MPRRYQRSRTKGAKLPDGVVCVTRPGRWGNPYKTREQFMVALAAILKGYYLSPEIRVHYEHMHRIAISVHELTGKDLACWCKPCDECHADDLLRVANHDRWLAKSSELREKADAVEASAGEGAK